MGLHTLVKAQIDSAHIGPFAERLHGHTWHIEARFSCAAGYVRDGSYLASELRIAIAPFDHGTVDEEIGREHATAEGLAGYLLGKLAHLGCNRIRVTRAGDDAYGAEAE